MVDFIVVVRFLVDRNTLNDGPNVTTNNDNQNALQDTEHNALIIAAFGVHITSNHGSNTGKHDLQDQDDQSQILSQKRVGIGTAFSGLRCAGTSIFILLALR